MLLRKKLFDISSLSVVSTRQHTSKKLDVIIAKGDSAASDHYFRTCDTSCLSNIKDTTSKPIILPDKSTISASQIGLLPNSNLSEIGRRVKILPQLRSASLISVGKLCDDGCTVHFDNNKMQVHKNDQIIMSGIRNHEDGLYDIPIAKVQVSENNY